MHFHESLCQISYRKRQLTNNAIISDIEIIVSNECEDKNKTITGPCPDVNPRKVHLEQSQNSPHELIVQKIMPTIIKGEGGNKLLVELDEVLKYGINLLNFQVMLNKCHVPRQDRGQEARIWITYHNRPILEIGVEEIGIVLQCNPNILDNWQKKTIEGINNYMNDYPQFIYQLLH